MRFGTDGLIYAWDGQTVWRQSGLNANGFGSAPIGTVPSNGADAGFYVVFACTDDNRAAHQGTSAFLLEPGLPAHDVAPGHG